MCVGPPQCVGLCQHMVGTYHQRVLHTLAVPSEVLHVGVVGRFVAVQTVIIFRIQAVVGLKEEGVRHGAVHALQPACQMAVAHQGRVDGIFAVGIVECREVEGRGEQLGAVAVGEGLSVIPLCQGVGSGVFRLADKGVKTVPSVALRCGSQCSQYDEA